MSEMTTNAAVGMAIGEGEACVRAGYAPDGTNMAHGLYIHKAYEANIVTLCDYNGIRLEMVTDSKTRYRLYMDGELTATYDDRKTAENMFVDFADISKKKLKAILKVAA